MNGKNEKQRVAPHSTCYDHDKLIDRIFLKTNYAN